MKALKTEHQRKKEEKEAIIYKEYVELRSNENNSKMEIVKLLMGKFEIYAPSTVYAIIKRVEKRLGK